MPKLNIIADCLGVDVNGIDSSNSEADPLEVKCRKDEQRSEFDSFGIKKISPDYYGMHGEGLCRHLKVDKNYRNKITKNEFFKLDQLSKFIAMCRPSKSSVDEANKEQHSILEIFECLYLFGMFYLQIYPKKNNQFFWITAHILVYALVLLCQMVCLKMIQNCKVGMCPTPIIIGHKIISR